MGRIKYLRCMTQPRTKNNSTRTASHLHQGKCDRVNLTHANVFSLEKGKENKKK